MTMRDKIAAIVADTYDSEDVLSIHCALVADAILAALPGMIPDLVWECVQTSFGPETYEAKCISGRYQVFTDEDSCAGAVFAEHATLPEYFGTVKATSISRVWGGFTAAKAAANAHHRAAIAQAAGWTND
jgi:hypothetical protein